MYFGAQKYQQLDLIKLYHGIVKREKLDEVKQRAGNYFGGLTPDIYGAVALSLICEKVAKIHMPITISGICKTSGSNDSATGKHTGILEDAPHFRGHDSYLWDSKVPKFYSVETIWADTALHALNDFESKKLYDRFNMATLNMYCKKKYKDYMETIDKHCKENNVSKVKMFIQYLKIYVFDKFMRIFRRVTRKKGDVIKKYVIVDIKEAEKISLEEIEKNITIKGVIDKINNLDI